jgi:hypothetical protein
MLLYKTIVIVLIYLRKNLQEHEKQYSWFVVYTLQYVITSEKIVFAIICQIM